MSVPLYMDEQVRSEITDGLRRVGVDVLTIQEDGRTGAADLLVLARATELGRVLFSLDLDMLEHATSCQRSGIHFFGLAYAPQLGVTIGQAIASLELLAKVSDPHDVADRIEYLPY